jgi:hypothetical protein
VRADDPDLQNGKQDAAVRLRTQDRCSGPRRSIWIERPSVEQDADRLIVAKDGDAGHAQRRET